MAAGLYALGFSLSRGICGHSQEDCPLSEVMMLIIIFIVIINRHLQEGCPLSKVFILFVIMIERVDE